MLCGIIKSANQNYLLSFIHYIVDVDNSDNNVPDTHSVTWSQIREFQRRKSTIDSRATEFIPWQYEEHSDQKQFIKFHSQICPTGNPELRHPARKV